MVLSFVGPKAPQRFELLRAALLSGGDGKGDRSPGTIRREARLFDLLDDISEPVGTDPDTRYLKLGGEPSIKMSEEDFSLLVDYANKTPWSPKASRAAVDLWEWLGQLKEETP